MSSKLVAVFFEGQHTAAGMLDTLRELERRGALSIEDAVVVSRAAVSEQLVLHPAGISGGPATVIPGSPVDVDQTTYRRGRGAAKGAGMGLLAGWLLGGPIGGLALGALVGGMIDRGIDDSFVDQVSGQLHSDSSALLVLAAAADLPAVLEDIRPFKGTVLSTELSPEAERSLRAALAHEK